MAKKSIYPSLFISLDKPNKKGYRPFPIVQPLSACYVPPIRSDPI